MHKQSVRLVQAKVSKRLGATNYKREMTVIIMQSDKATLNQAWKLYRYSEIKDHQGLTDFLYSLKYA